MGEEKYEYESFVDRLSLLELVALKDILEKRLNEEKENIRLKSLGSPTMQMFEIASLMKTNDAKRLFMIKERIERYIENINIDHIL